MSKKNIRKVPDYIIAKVNGLKKDDLVVECVKKIPKSAIEQGLASRQGISIENNAPVFEADFIPDTRIGRYSKRNIEGYEIVLREEPKILKTWEIEVPNFGDWGKGSHYIDFSKMVYQREFISPRFNPIHIEVLNYDVGTQSYIFKFSVEEVLNRKDSQFNNDLFFNLNMLQEFVGTIDVFESTTTKDDYLKTIFVDWEILPVEETQNNIQILLGNSGIIEPKKQKEFIERFTFIDSLKPIRYVYGTSGFARYYGAQFKNDLVVFENNKYGNASYIMFENWEELSKKSRISLLTSINKGFVRIRHTQNWKRNLEKIINEQMT